VTLWVEDDAPTERVLVDTLGFRAVAESADAHRFEIGAGGPGTYVDVRTVGGGVRGLGGAGTVHHVAFTVADDAAELAARDRVLAAALQATEPLDRHYFRSVYFREPGGILYELATAGPGFAVDEPVERLGLALQLPPQYEPRRVAIEAALPPIRLPAPAAEVARHDAAPLDATPGAVAPDEA
jgi:glyoxalase family protein